MAVPLTVIKSYGIKGARGGWTFFRKFRIFFITTIFIIILLNTVIIAVRETPDEGFKYIGARFVGPTHTLNEESVKIIDRGGLYVNDQGFLKGIWEAIKSIWYFTESFIVILIWFRIFTHVFTNYIIWDESKRPVGRVIGIGFFFVIQVIYILAFTDGNWYMPFMAFYNFILAMATIIPGLANMGDYFVDKVPINSTI